ncbi:MAG: type IX secretion system membrane protein PorP/SprF [Brevinema sp.]
MPKALVFIFGLCFLSTVTFAQEERILDKNPRSLGMGGVGVSTFGYPFSPNANPASLGLMYDYTIVPIFEIGLSMSPEAVDLGTTLGRGLNNIADIDFDKFLNKSIGAGLTSPFNIGFMGKGFGIWLTAGAEGRIAVFTPPGSELEGIKINTLFDTVTQVSNLVGSSAGGIDINNQADIEKIINEGIFQDLKNSGLSDAEAYNRINGILNQISGNTGANIEFISPDGTVDINKVKDELTDGGNNFQLNEAALLEILPRIHARLYADIAVNVGYGYKIAFRGLDDKSGLSLGATLRFIQRFKSDTLNGDVTIDEAVNNLTILQGFAVTSDFGLSLQLQNFVLGFAVRDAFSTPFQWTALLTTGDSGARTTSSFAPSYDIGISYRFLFTNPWIQEVGLYIEGVDLASRFLEPIEKFRAGMELKLFRFLDLRVGVYDGFVTTGLGMGGKWGRIDFAYYRESFKLFDNFSVYGDRVSLSLALLYENTPERKARTAARKAIRQEQTANAEAAAKDALEAATRRQI